MTQLVKTSCLGSRLLAGLSSHPKRYLVLSSNASMPYKPEERLPMTDKEKRLYPQVEQEFSEEGYPILKFKPKPPRMFDPRPPRRRRVSMYTDRKAREEILDEKIDWPSYWQTPKTFSPHSVPLPLRQGYKSDNRAAPSKHNNLELMKITNFLHLTPPAIQRHCRALKKFCSAWPGGLETDEKVRSHFPVTYVTKDYLHAAPTIRDERARVVCLRIHIDDLKLNMRDKDKFITLLTPQRYDEKTGMITIRTDACPMKIQNQDYADYLLTAVYYESMKHEKWEEDDLEEIDWRRFEWQWSDSKQRAKTLLKKLKQPVDDELVERGEGEVLSQYADSLKKIYEKEDKESLESYRQGVERLLGIKERATAQ